MKIAQQFFQLVGGSASECGVSGIHACLPDLEPLVSGLDRPGFHADTLFTCCVTCNRFLILPGHCSCVDKTSVVCIYYSMILLYLLCTGCFPFLS